MATTEFSHADLGAPHGLRQVFEAGAARFAAMWAAVKNRRSVNNLLSWDDRMLADIGLTHGDVRGALAARLSEDPSQCLRSFSQERREAVRAQGRALYTFDE
jgi:uncharacterized protein YjiS (DUF1127 family)